MKKTFTVAPLLAILAASPLHAATPSQPKPAGNPGTWITPEDYPDAARQAGKEGSVRFTLQVDAQGVPTGCSVVQGSGDASLDEATCRLISQRARFTAATGKNGKPTTGVYTNTVRWQLPAASAPEPIVMDRRLFAPDYCIEVWKGNAAVTIAHTGLSLCAR